MVEFNANGLHAFFTLMKNFSVAMVKFGKEWVVFLIVEAIKKMRQIKDWIKRKFQEYFIKKDLSKDQL
jgi:hypothetical protein